MMKRRNAIVAMALAILSAPGVVAVEKSARIVNGLPTQDDASTGALLYSFGPIDNIPAYQGICTGVMAGCRTFITAAHCVCANDGDSFSTCTVEKPDNLRVFLQHGEIYEVDSVTMNPAYHFGQDGDIAVLTLKQPADGIPPSELNETATPDYGTAGRIVGFGSTDGLLSDDGDIKREGDIVTASCSGAENGGIPVTEPEHVCWRFEEPVGPAGDDSNTCFGDSGGPLFVDLGGGEVVAGITSGGQNGSCLTTDVSYDTNVFENLDFIQSAAALSLSKETAKCRSSVRKLAGKYVGTVYKARQKCLEAVNAGKIPGLCPDIKAQSELQKAEAGLDPSKIAKSCPASVISVAGFAGECESAETAADLKNCIMSAGDAAVDRMLDAEYADDDPSGPIGDVALLKCQSAIAKASGKYGIKNIGTLNKCESGQDSGKVSECPDAKTEASVDKMAASLDSGIRKSCTDGQIDALDSGNAFGGACSGAGSLSAIVDCLIEEHDEADDQVVEIAAQDVNDLSFSSCGTIPQVGDSETEIVKGDESTGNEIAAGSFEHTFTVPAGIGRFRVTLNAGEDSGFNDVDLYVKFDATPVPDPFFENPDADAYSFNYGTYEALEVIAPAAGTWHVLVVEAGFSSGEPYQVTMTTFTGP